MSEPLDKAYCSGYLQLRYAIVDLVRGQLSPEDLVVEANKIEEKVILPHTPDRQFNSIELLAGLKPRF